MEKKVPNGSGAAAGAGAGGGGGTGGAGGGTTGGAASGAITAIRRRLKEEEGDATLSVSCPIPCAGIGFWKEQNNTNNMQGASISSVGGGGSGGGGGGVTSTNTVVNNSESEPERNRPFLIGVAGGTASGKTTVCDIIIQKLADQRVATISLDSFYRALTNEELADVGNHNFDHPDAFDWELLYQTLDTLSRGKTASIPTYDFTTHSRLPASICNTIHGSISDIIIIEGILLFHPQQVLGLLDMKLFVDTDADTRLARRVRRDMSERGRSLESILYQYEKFVKPAFDQYILPTKKYADVVIPRGSSNTIAIDLIVQHIKQKLFEKRAKRQRIINTLIGLD